MAKRIIYLDNGATTPLRPEVARAMTRIGIRVYGNPSSPHALGEKSLAVMNESRAKLAKLINAKAHEIVFVSGGTEANNLALHGLAASYPKKKKIIVSAIEHSSISELCVLMKRNGYEIFEIPVSDKGLINAHKLEKEIDNETLLVSIIHANNETGTIQDLKSIGELCKRKKVFFHTDAVQSFGKEQINVHSMRIDLLSASAHKIGGPKGIGFLYVREGISLKPMIVGGKQERGLRGGTENVPAIVGFATATEVIKKINKEKIKKLRDYFIKELEKLGGSINGSMERRLYNNIHVSFEGLDAEMAALALSQKGIMCSTRSACLSKQHAESRVLRALNLSEDKIRGSLRFVLDESVAKKDIDFVIKQVKTLFTD